MLYINIIMLLITSLVFIISLGFGINYGFQIIKIHRLHKCKFKTLFPLYITVITSLLLSLLVGYHTYRIIIN
jgi:hypothetical protein